VIQVDEKSALLTLNDSALFGKVKGNRMDWRIESDFPGRIWVTVPRSNHSEQVNGSAEYCRAQPLMVRLR
jgi:hypothetical protein